LALPGVAHDPRALAPCRRMIRCRSAQDERVARHSITSSARASSTGGMSQPARFPKDRKLRKESRFVICCH